MTRSGFYKNDILSSGFLDLTHAESLPPGISFFELSGVRDVLPLAPNFLFGDIPAHLCREMFHKTSVHRIGYYSIERCHLTYDGIILRDGRKVMCQEMNVMPPHCQDVLAWALPEEGPIPVRHLDGPCVLLYGPGWRTWGHWLSDFLPRIFSILCCGIDPSRLKWIVPRDLPDYALRLIRQCGLDDAHLAPFDHREEILSIGALLCPVNLTAAPLVHPMFSGYCDWIKSRFSTSGPQEKPDRRKIFISRTRVSSHRALLNRPEVESIAVDFGYDLIAPEHMPVEEQIRLFATATHIAGEYGSGLHTSIFSPPHATITCLRGTLTSPGFLQTGLAAACHQRIGYVFGTMRPDLGHESYEVDPAFLRWGLGNADIPSSSYQV
ncbi:conserved hypothetical protein [Gluconacetobacter diazotrophicus PA1 5]|uniref:Glycosyltransferase 61 catalytic domain-containing protein n=2 Tax=Gluconacetobacter diazotrophicus TaxID=33996 RepID=A9HGU2_GLUDA|nr:glycosyltransferase family 61 protein [Gluconacetobacter diazotrophicus]ACI51572.1 conserved hypothetical protein [Gluconacetobacter diazotrophicus PA1 5]MBB2157579.1 glycosyltransferase family 61 protein [Gluconacetobacter diazotrophicus]TWB03439.1 uncharacterized protein DUF563 [Gluconacetobacter diazotrophicus]CAP55549.1 hypothetical protein GDI1606 [Gluconacetobacter diazotrophicus PA1 5]